MGLLRLPVRVFSRHSSVASHDRASPSEGGSERGRGHRAEGQFLACTFVRFTRSVFYAACEEWRITRCESAPIWVAFPEIAIIVRWSTHEAWSR